MNYEAFISYRRKNSEVAREIYHALREDRHTVFFDVDSLHAGDFTAEIKSAIRSSELVVALLTCDSVRRMVDDPQADMVRKELQTARQEERPIQFLWLKEEDGADIYKLLKSYPDDELLQWMAGQNIMDFTADSEDIRHICGKVVETLRDERRRKFEQLRTSTPPEGKPGFTVGGRRYTYHGSCRRDTFGEAFPYGEGAMVEERSPQYALVYEGDWEGDKDFSGSGAVYREYKDGTRKLIYRGHWTYLNYHDMNGQLFDPETGECVAQGIFLDGEPVDKGDSHVFQMELYDLKDREKKLYSGAATDKDGLGGLRKIYGRETLDGGGEFQGWYDRGRPDSGEIRFPGGEIYSGEVGEQTAPPLCGETRKRVLRGPSGFGRMLYPGGIVYEGEWTGSEGRFFWSGYGAAVYPGEGFEVRVEGGFSDNGPSKSKNGLKVSVRPAGEQEFRLFYTSPGDDINVPGCASSGYVRITFRDGTVYDGSMDSMSLRRGSLLTPDGREYAVEKIATYMREEDTDREAKELVLRCLDELWEVFRPVMEPYPKRLMEFCSQVFTSVAWGVLPARGDLPGYYPWGATLPRRALAMCQMPPSQLTLLGEEEFRAVQKWFNNDFRRSEKAEGLTALEELSRQEEQAGLSEEDLRILSGDIRSREEVKQYIDLLIRTHDPHAREKMQEAIAKMDLRPSN